MLIIYSAEAFFEPDENLNLVNRKKLIPQFGI